MTVMMTVPVAHPFTRVSNHLKHCLLAGGMCLNLLHHPSAGISLQEVTDGLCRARLVAAVSMASLCRVELDQWVASLGHSRPALNLYDFT
jgi:hypothetical protein